MSDSSLQTRVSEFLQLPVFFPLLTSSLQKHGIQLTIICFVHLLVIYVITGKVKVNIFCFVLMLLVNIIRYYVYPCFKVTIIYFPYNLLKFQTQFVRIV